MRPDEATRQRRHILRLFNRDMSGATCFRAQCWLAENPRDGLIWWVLGVACFEMCRFAEAISALRRAARLRPPEKLHLVYHRLGETYKCMGARQIAERWHRKAIESCPENASHRTMLGSVLSYSGRLQEAEMVYRRATQCKEGRREEAFLDLGLTLRALERCPEARQCIRRALEINPRYKAARHALRDVEEVLEQTKQERRASISRQMSQGQRRRQWDHIFRHFRRDLFGSACLRARRWLADNPKDGFVWLVQGIALYKMHRYEDAVGALRRAARLCPSRALHLVYHHLGEVEKWKGALQAAEQWYRKAIANCPSEASHRITLGLLFSYSERLHEAENAYRRATRCKKGCREEAFLNLGLTLRTLERYPEARTCVRHALDIDPKYKEAKKALMDIEYVLKASRSA